MHPSRPPDLCTNLRGKSIPRQCGHSLLGAELCIVVYHPALLGSLVSCVFSLLCMRRCFDACLGHANQLVYIVAPGTSWCHGLVGPLPRGQWWWSLGQRRRAQGVARRSGGKGLFASGGVSVWLLVTREARLYSCLCLVVLGKTPLACRVFAMAKMGSAGRQAGVGKKTYRLPIDLTTRGILAAIGYARLLVRPKLRQPVLELFRRLNLDLLPLHRLSGRGVARRDAPILLGLVEVLDDAVAVLIQRLLGDAFHAEDFHLEALSVRQRILDLAECFLVHLVQMNG